MRQWLVVCLLWGCDSGGGTQFDDAGRACDSPGTCTPFGPPLPLPPSEVAQRIVGRWVGCGATIVTFAPDQAGLEFTADRHLYVLHPDGAGNLVRGQGTMYEFTWEIADGGPSVSMRVITANGGVLLLVVQMTDSPRALQLQTMAPQTLQYVAGCPTGVDSPDAGSIDLCSLPVADRCKAPEGPVWIPPSLDELGPALMGSWRSCGGSIFPSVPDEAGIELRGDRYTILRVDGAGQFVRGQGVHYEGTWTIYQPNQVTLIRPDGATISSNVAFEVDPQRIIISDIAPRVLLEPSCEQPQPAPGPTPNSCAGGTAGQCNLISGPWQSYSSETEYLTLLIGRWLKCSGDDITVFDPNQAGLEINADGTFTWLYRDAMGNLVRGTTGTERGTWELLHDIAVFQFNFVASAGGTVYSFLAFEIGPSRMWISNATASGDVELVRDCGDLVVTP